VARHRFETFRPMTISQQDLIRRGDTVGVFSSNPAMRQLQTKCDVGLRAPRHPLVDHPARANDYIREYVRRCARAWTPLHH